MSNWRMISSGWRTPIFMATLRKSSLSIIPTPPKDLFLVRIILDPAGLGWLPQYTGSNVSWDDEEVEFQPYTRLKELRYMFLTFFYLDYHSDYIGPISIARRRLWWLNFQVAFKSTKLDWLVRRSSSMYCRFLRERVGHEPICESLDSKQGLLVQEKNVRSLEIRLMPDVCSLSFSLLPWHIRFA